MLCHSFLLTTIYNKEKKFIKSDKGVGWWRVCYQQGYLYSFPYYNIPGEISSNLYRASVCDMAQRTFLLISLSQILYYTFQTTCYGITKNILGKLPDHWWLQITTFNFEGCHTLTHIFQILIIIIFSTQLMTNVIQSDS